MMELKAKLYKKSARLIKESEFTHEEIAKMKGKIIGRVRKRNAALIHSLLEAGLSFREVARIAKCSHGIVSASKKELLQKKAKLEQEKIQELLLI